ncbi:hypothetical protein ACFY36_01185 [Actinoplanes sp. NPDC000266]
MKTDSSPRWVWIVAGVIVAAYGVVLDRYPDYARTYGTTLVILLTVAALAGGRRSARRPWPHVRPDRAVLIAGVLGAIVLVGGMVLAGARHVSHVALAIGLAGGFLLALGGPWWQRRAGV